MKKKILIAIALVVLLIGILCACSNKLEPGDSTILYNPKKDNMEIVKDMDAYDLIKKAYTTYQNSSQYKPSMLHTSPYLSNNFGTFSMLMHL